MNLIIEKCSKLNLKKFIEQVIIPKSIKIFYSIVDRKRYIPFQLFLEEKYNKKINLDHILAVALKTLTFKKIGDDYIIQIDSNIKSPEIPAKLIDICALVNYGNLALNPYPIFDIVMERLSKEVPSLYIEYKLLGGK